MITSTSFSSARNNSKDRLASAKLVLTIPDIDRAFRNKSIQGNIISCRQRAQVLCYVGTPLSELLGIDEITPALPWSPGSYLAHLDGLSPTVRTADRD